VPFHLDTYGGCVYNCSYCFARDFFVFNRRNNPDVEKRVSTYLIGNNPKSFERWVNTTYKMSYDYDKANAVAFKERMPLKIGATSDPCPFIETHEKITYGFLKILHEMDYPVEIQTKNPEVLLTYCNEFVNPNWVIAVTIISADEQFVKLCEPNAISSERRLSAIKKLTANGFNVIVKIQPAIYPKIISDLPILIPQIANSGAQSFNVEGFKVRISMPKEEQALIQKIGDSMGYNVRDFYKKQQKTGSDWELTNKIKLEYINLAKDLAQEHKLTFYVADNNMGKIGDGDECCGTSVLRNYKVWRNNSKSNAFGITENHASELGKCKISSLGLRGNKNINKTIDTICDTIRDKPIQGTLI
jgi:DNA repair photolyase